MDIRDFVHHTKATAPAAGADPMCGLPSCRDSVPVPAERATDLQDAWHELTEAALSSKVSSFRVFTRSGDPWTEDPEAVRAVTAVLRDFPANRADR